MKLSGNTLLSLLPGSRLQEVKRMMPIYKEALEILKEDKTDLTVIIPTTFSHDLVKVVESNISRWNVPVVLLPGASIKEKYEAFNVSQNKATFLYRVDVVHRIVLGKTWNYPTRMP